MSTLTTHSHWGGGPKAPPSEQPQIKIFLFFTIGNITEKNLLISKFTQSEKETLSSGAWISAISQHLKVADKGGLIKTNISKTEGTPPPQEWTAYIAHRRWLAWESIHYTSYTSTRHLCPCCKVGDEPIRVTLIRRSVITTLHVLWPSGHPLPSPWLLSLETQSSLRVFSACHAEAWSFEPKRAKLGKTRLKGTLEHPSESLLKEATGWEFPRRLPLG